MRQTVAAPEGRLYRRTGDADLSSLYRFGDGGLSPLTGPMDRATFNQVLDEELPRYAEALARLAQ